MTEVGGKVTLKQFKKNGWLPDGHDGELRYTHCFEQLVVNVDTKTGLHVTGLTEEDEKYFESKMQLKEGALSRYNSDYWSKFKIKIPKKGKVLNLDIAADGLMYKVLLAHQQVANSEAEKHDSPWAEYVLTSLEQEAKANNAKNKLEKKANKVYYNWNTDEMVDFLKVYGKNPGSKASVDFIEDTVHNIIKDNPKAFLAIVEDPDYKMKLFIQNSVSQKVLLKEGSKYLLQGGDVLGYSLEDTIKYLSKPENQEIYVNLKNRLELDK